MKILIVCKYLPGPGQSKGGAWVAKNLATGLSEKGHDVTYLCNQVGRGHHNFDVKIEKETDYKKLYDNKGLQEFINSFDIIHFHTAFYNPFFLSLPQIAKVPVVFTLHARFPIDLIEYYPKFSVAHLNNRTTSIVHSMQHVSKYIAVADYCKFDHLMVQGSYDYLNFSKGNIDVIHNGIDPRIFHKVNSETRESLKEQYGLKGKKVVLFVGRLESEKGADIALKVAKHFEARKDTAFVFFGQAISTQEGQAEEYLKQINERKNTLFIEHFESDGHTIYNLADIFFLPTQLEMFPLVNLEAMACGLPILTTKVGGISEAVKNKVNGYLTTRIDFAKMCSRLEKLLGDEGLRNEFGEKGKAKVEQRFKLGAMVDKHVDLYSALAK